MQRLNTLRNHFNWRMLLLRIVVNALALNQSDRRAELSVFVDCRRSDCAAAGVALATRQSARTRLKEKKIVVLKFISATRFLVIIPIIGLALTASVLFVLAGFGLIAFII